MSKTLSYKNYCGSVEVSFEDSCLHGELLFINDLVTYEAQTVEDLEKAFQGAVDYYIDKCSRENLKADKPFSGSFNVRISPEKHRAASIKAASKGVSLNELIGMCVDSYLDDVKTVLNINQKHEHYHYSKSDPITAQYEEDSQQSWTQSAKPSQRKPQSVKPVRH